MAVTISGCSTISHNGSATVTGTGFGTPVAPEVYDDCSGSNILTLWDGGWPTETPGTALGYRAAQRSIAMPHSRISKYMCGAHSPAANFNNGGNVIFWKNTTLSGYPSHFYCSWYQRFDDAWAFGGGSPADDNLKNFAVSKQGSPYELPDNSYISYNEGPPNSSDVSEWMINDDLTDDPDCGSFSGGLFFFCNLQDLDANGEDHWWQNYVNPFNGQWEKHEVEMGFSDQSGNNGGYIKYWVNGVQKINYVGRNHIVAGLAITIGVGGFARSINANNWRYFADIYWAYSRSRVTLGNASTFAACTNRETCVIQSGNSTSITFTGKLGAFADDDTAWLYVVSSDGSVNANGFEVTLSEGAGSGALPLILLQH